MRVLLIALSSFGATFFAVSAAGSFALARRDRLGKRLEVYQGFDKREEPGVQPAPRRRRLSLRPVRPLPLRNLERLLAEADWPLRSQEFLLLTLLLALVPSLLLILAGRWLALPLALALPLLPFLSLRRARRKRTARFNEQLVETLEVMVNSLRSGFTFLQSMELASEESQPPLSSEFARALREIGLGTPTEEALRKLAERVRSEDLELMVTAMLIQRQVGGNLAEVLGGIARTIRERVRMAGEIKTLTAQGRLSGWVVGLLPFILSGVLLLLNPSYIMLLVQEPLGRLLALGGILAEAIGALLIRKMVNMEY